jgi:hypothetical protein
MKTLKLEQFKNCFSVTTVQNKLIENPQETQQFCKILHVVNFIHYRWCVIINTAELLQWVLHVLTKFLCYRFSMTTGRNKLIENPQETQQFCKILHTVYFITLS